MRVAKFMFIAAGILLFAGSHAVWAEPYKDHKVGLWDIHVLRHNGLYIACLARRIYTPRLELGLSIWRDGHAEMSMIDDDWAPLRAATIPVTLTLDQGPTITLRGAVDENVLISIDLTEADLLRRNLKSGAQLRFRTEVGTHVFEMAGVKDALSAITQCSVQELSGEKAAQ